MGEFLQWTNSHLETPRELRWELSSQSSLSDQALLQVLLEPFAKRIVRRARRQLQRIDGWRVDQVVHRRQVGQGGRLLIVAAGQRLAAQKCAGRFGAQRHAEWQTARDRTGELSRMRLSDHWRSHRCLQVVPSARKKRRAGRRD